MDTSETASEGALYAYQACETANTTEEANIFGIKVFKNIYPIAATAPRSLVTKGGVEQAASICFQCVEFVRRYLIDISGGKAALPGINAAIGTFPAPGQSPLDRAQFDLFWGEEAGKVAQVGDIIVFDGNVGGGFGHIAVVRGREGQSVQFIGQNQTGSALYQTRPQGGSAYSWANAAILGIARLKDNFWAPQFVAKRNEALGISADAQPIVDDNAAPGTDDLDNEIVDLEPIIPPTNPGTTTPPAPPATCPNTADYSNLEIPSCPNMDAQVVAKFSGLENQLKFLMASACFKRAADGSFPEQPEGDNPGECGCLGWVMQRYLAKCFSESRSWGHPNFSCVAFEPSSTQCALIQ